MHAHTPCIHASWYRMTLAHSVRLGLGSLDNGCFLVWYSAENVEIVCAIRVALREHICI